VPPDASVPAWVEGVWSEGAAGPTDLVVADDPKRGRELRGLERDDTTALSTFAPARNFTIPLAARVRAAAGPPAYAVRKRRIEDLEDEVLATIGEALATSPDLASARRALEGDRRIARRLRELAVLVDAHNRFYPVEANLPLDPKTGALLERGRRWEPLPPPSLDGFVARASAAAESDPSA
jgi:hypothetical protein